MPDFCSIKNALESGGFFAKKTWKISPDAYRLSPEEIAELENIGTAAIAFYRALEKLYLASAENRSLLRNGKLFAPWVSEILNRGKPPRLVAHQSARALAGTLPPVIRPDLLVCEDGFALTELDSVPGGIGLTAFLNRLYACGNADAMPQLFLDAVTRGAARSRVAIAVSDEADDYRAEFEQLAETLRAQGAEISVCHPNETEISENGVFLRGKKIDVLYRFFELFDLGNVNAANALFTAAERGNVVVTPPMRPFQEEKSALALLHHPTLFPFWTETLGEKNFSLIKKIVPETWLVEPLPEHGLPACAVLHAPTVGGRAIRNWSELAAAGRRDRELVLKASGFDETAWGARSVTVGTDVSQRDWALALENALNRARERNSFYVLQRFHKPAKKEFRIFDAEGNAVPAFGRVRICPYYFVVRDEFSRERVHLGGALCTFCPPDKKIIHGMSDAVLAPCAL
ncbi:MAG: hypothetical protein IJN19_02980 [Opitutales bacterium]|nr:hypothetical protein [Opitutales bacterium]